MPLRYKFVVFALRRIRVGNGKNVQDLSLHELIILPLFSFFAHHFPKSYELALAPL